MTLADRHGMLPVGTSPEEDNMQIWFKFDAPDDEEPSHTANIFTEDDGARVEWWNEDVGLVTTEHHPDTASAERALESSGYTDFTA